MRNTEVSVEPHSVDGRVLSTELIREARKRIHEYLPRTPMIGSQTLTEEFGCPVFLKLECLQKTGSFKPRGAFNKLLSLTTDEREQGVVGVSGGNHAQGLAYAAHVLGIDAVICMPANTPANYVEATRRYGANIHFCDDIRQAFATAARLQAEGRVLVHPFDDPLIAAGQGTIALEMLEEVPDLTRVYISIGGGGLIAGMATVFKELRPELQVIGVETRGADVMSLSVEADEMIELPAITSIARTLGAPKVSDLTFEAVKNLVDELVVVEDVEAVEAMIFLLERTKTLVEPAGACCLAAARRQRASFGSEEKIAILLCGGNVAVSDLASWSHSHRLARSSDAQANLTKNE